MTDVDQVPILDFMLVRPPSDVDRSVLRRRYIRDVILTKGDGTYTDVDLQSPGSPSAVARVVYQEVFAVDHDAEPLAQIKRGVLGLLIARDQRSVSINELERRAYLREGEFFYLLPDRVEYIPAALSRSVARMWPLLTETAALPGPVAPDFAEQFTDQVRKLFDGHQLATVVYDGPYYTDAFQSSKRAFFDALYILYVLRRWTSVNFERVMDGLRALHVLETLAIDELYRDALAGRFDPRTHPVLNALWGEYPQLRGWTGADPLPGFPLIGSPAGLGEYLEARPIVHPIFAQLHHYAQPFNRIKPLGVGDLKVVKQWLVGYEPGEISDIHNVMQGETKERLHRRLERTEESFSSTTSSQSESSRDTASTDRFEVKREAENVVKTDLNVNANMRAQYDNKVVLVAVGAGFAYTRNTSDQQKIGQNFSREVVDKAVTRVQNSASATRSVAKLFETEETNRHTFANIDGTGHVAGVYQWVDKRYKAQVFNYGKRMMFEFVLPEPAAFLVESRLRAFEETLDRPTRPVEPTYREVALDFAPEDITPGEFQRLSQRYDLSAFTYPAATKTVELFNQEAGAAIFSEAGLNRRRVWHAKSYRCKLDSAGYEVQQLRITGLVQFVDHDAPTGDIERNIVSLRIDGTTLWYEEHSNLIYNFFGDDHTVATGPYLLTRDEVDVTFAFQEIDRYDLLVTATLTRSADLLSRWQTEVWQAVAAAERTAVDAANTELRLRYDSAMATYRSRLAELRGTAIHDLIQGQSEAYNRDLIRTELRRQCLAMLTREFDSESGDDLLTSWDAIAERPVTVGYRRFAVDETDPVSGGWKTESHEVGYPLPDLTAAQAKGRYVQFLEQAFEWDRIGYVCYPYFWAAAPKWIELMNRADDADPQLTAFLRAGAVKVLVAVTPAYDDAVLHFLATREPWEGGPAPVLGDPLYLPIFEELHRQQDDRHGATPDGEPWSFTLPTSLVYLHGSTTPLPPVPQNTP